MNESRIVFFRNGLHVPLILSACLLFYNPTLLFMPSAPVHMEFFPAGVFSLLALSMILLSSSCFFQTVKELKVHALSALIVFFVTALLHYLIHKEYRFIHFGASLLWITVPFCSLVFYSAFRKIFLPFLALYGIWEIIFCILFPRRGGIWGIPGNINFTAALLILTFPFLVFYLRRYLLEHHFSRWSTRLLLPPVILCGIIFFAACSSRGAFLGFFCTALLFLFLHLSDRFRKIMFYGVLFCAVAGGLLFVRFGVEPLSRIIADEDRPFFYSGTLKMIADHPLLGVGGVSFETEFVKYKPLEYFFARHVAERTDHPHNQELFMLSQYGVFGYSAWAFLLYFPLIVLLRRIYRRERVAPEIRLCLFVFLCCLIHAQLDLVFYFFPTYLIMLLMLGLFWKETLASKNRETAFNPAVFPLASACACRLFGIFIFCLAFLGALRASYSSWMTWRLLSVPMPRGERLEKILRIVEFAPDEYKQNYALMVLSAKLNAPETVLKVTDAMIGSHIRNYGHVYFHRGAAYAALGYIPEAYEAYRREAANYPLAVLPYLRMITLAKKMGKPELLPPLEQSLNDRLKLREINPEMLQAIQENPFYDLRPWWIPKEKGGPGGMVVFPDGRKENWY